MGGDMGTNINNSYYIDSINIRNLWGSRNLYLDFSKAVNIIIGPNASGKTTILNMLNFVISADFIGLSGLVFEEVEICIRSFRGKAKKTIRVISRETGIDFSIGRKVFKIDIDALDYRRPVAYRRRMMIQQREQVAELMGGLVPAVWLPVSRRLPIPEDEERERVYARGKSLESVDERLRVLMRELEVYRLTLDKQLAIRYKKFEKSIFQLMLYNKEYDEFSLTRGVVNIGEDKAHLLNAFEAAEVLDDEMRERIDIHFKTAEAARKRIVKPGGEGINAHDVFVIPLIRRTRSMIALARELENDRDDIFAPLRHYEGIGKTFIRTKDVRVADSGEMVVTDLQSGRMLKFSALSSGEKQIMILLTQALLWEDRPVVYVADEPELSLHVEWQEKLISSLLELGGEIQIIVATHSPDIIGSYRNNVIDLEKQIK
jgi:energy-coupling factor transporter ATP-binding protein EcfA2